MLAIGESDDLPLAFGRGMTSAYSRITRWRLLLAGIAGFDLVRDAFRRKASSTRSEGSRFVEKMIELLERRPGYFFAGGRC